MSQIPLSKRLIIMLVFTPLIGCGGQTERPPPLQDPPYTDHPIFADNHEPVTVPAAPYGVSPCTEPQDLICTPWNPVTNTVCGHVTWEDDAGQHSEVPVLSAACLCDADGGASCACAVDAGGLRCPPGHKVVSCVDYPLQVLCD